MILNTDKNQKKTKSITKLKYRSGYKLQTNYKKTNQSTDSTSGTISTCSYPLSRKSEFFFLILSMLDHRLFTPQVASTAYFKDNAD